MGFSAASGLRLIHIMCERLTSSSWDVSESHVVDNSLLHRIGYVTILAQNAGSRPAEVHGRRTGSGLVLSCTMIPLEQT